MTVRAWSLPLAAVAALLLGGCLGEDAPPPVVVVKPPPPPKPELPNGPERKQKAIAAATAFATEKKYDKSLDFTKATASYGKSKAPFVPDQKPPPPWEGWTVWVPVAKNADWAQLIESSGEEGPVSDVPISARCFLVSNDGTVKEGAPLRMPRITSTAPQQGPPEQP